MMKEQLPNSFLKNTFEKHVHYAIIIVFTKVNEVYNAVS